MKKDLHLDVLRCAMNYMIVLLHAWAAFQYVRWDTVEFAVWTFICNYLCWMSMPTFFLISGYLLFASFSLSVFAEKIFRRFKRLVIPYVAWNLFFVLFYLAISPLNQRLKQRVSSFGLDTFAGAFSKVISLTEPPIDGPLWFLRVLVLLCLVSPIFLFFLRIGRGIPTMFLAFLWCIAECTWGITSTMQLTFPAYAVFCFLLGGTLALNGRDLIASFQGWFWLPMGFGACAVRGWLLIPGSMECVPRTMSVQLLSALLILLEAPALIAIVQRLPVECIAKSRIYRFAKEMSFFAYASHFLFCSIWLHVCAPIFSFIQIGKFTFLVLVFVVPGLTTVFVVHHLARRFFPRILSVFDGTL